MNRIKYKLLLFFTILLVPVTLWAADIQTDLNGFRLLQFKTAVEAFFGKPFQTFKTKSSTAEAYRVDSDAYMVFEYLNDLPNNIFSIQLTGHTSKALPFRGLMLGDDVKRVNDILGKPSQVKKIESPDVTEYDYERTNYSVEIDDKNKLYSIRLYSNRDFTRRVNEEFKAYDEFKDTILKKDLSGILSMLRPDVEIYKGEKVLSIKRRYADFVANPDKEIITALLGDSRSVLKEVAESEPEGELRLIMNFGIGEVYKFYKGKILEEIVFFPYNGKYRVYEIRFRKE
jgi:c-di-AMP phosphodiesterase-like protein